MFIGDDFLRKPQPPSTHTASQPHTQTDRGTSFAYGLICMSGYNQGPVLDAPSAKRQWKFQPNRNTTTTTTKKKQTKSKRRQLDRIKYQVFSRKMERGSQRRPCERSATAIRFSVVGARSNDRVSTRLVRLHKHSLTGPFLDRFLPSFTEFDRLRIAFRSGFTPFYRVLLGFTEFDWL